MIDACCLLVDALRQEHSRDHAEALRSTFPEENGGALLDELGTVHETEPYSALVLRSEVLLIKINDLCRLSYHTTVDNSLIVRSYTRCVMQDHNLGFEVIDGLGLRFSVNQDHSLSEIVTLELLFLDLGLDGEADCLASHGLLNIDTLVMDAFNLHGIELTLLIRAEQ